MKLPITINTENFILHCSGAMFWESKNMLLISDVHLGKIAHFRKNGIALPNISALGNFKKLDWVVSEFKPDIICFLGDLFHSSLNNEFLEFGSWTKKIDSKIILIAGNHDIISPEKYEAIHVKVASEWIVDGFLLTHHPEDRTGLFTLCGHIHPAINLYGKGRQSMKLPCFFRTENQIIFPAFGEFTGKHVLKPTEKDLIYILTKEDVILLEK